MATCAVRSVLSSFPTDDCRRHVHANVFSCMHFRCSAWCGLSPLLYSLFVIHSWSCSRVQLCILGVVCVWVWVRLTSFYDERLISPIVIDTLHLVKCRLLSKELDSDIVLTMNGDLASRASTSMHTIGQVRR